MKYRTRTFYTAPQKALMSLSDISQLQLNAIARQSNARPRKTLGFHTPAEMFSECVAATG